MELRVTVRNGWEARSAMRCGVLQLDVRDVQTDRSASPSPGTIRTVAAAVPDRPIVASLCDDLGSHEATALAAMGAVAAGATTLVVDLTGCADAASAAARLRAVSDELSPDGVTVAGRFCVDAVDRATVSEAADIVGAAGCSGVVLETAHKPGRLTDFCDLAQLAEITRRCHDADLTCVAGGGFTIADIPALRGTEIDAVALRSVVATGVRRESRLDPWMMCRAVERSAGVPALRN